MSRNKNIHENRSGFKVPEDYFNTLENSLMNQLKSETLAKKSGFKVPEDYFSDFELKTPTEENSSKVIQLKDWSKWVAAAAIVAFAVIGALYIDSMSPNKNLQFSDLDNDMIERYLDFNLETPEDYIDFENTTVKKLVDENITTLNDQDIIEYLNDNLDDQDFDNE